MLTGKTLGEANSRLSARGLRSAVPTYDCFGADRPQEVVSQDPKPGTRVSATATVSVSVQDDCATVPSVVGQSLSAAVKTLRDAGFSSIIQGGGGNDGGGQGTDIVYLQFPGSGTSQPKSRTMFVQAESAAQPEPSPPAAANAQQG
jgi:eukaryotic-like serine/threonine-protein kinase